MSSSRKKRFYNSKRFWASLALLVGIVALVQRPVLSGSAAFAAEVFCARQGMEFRAESVSAGLFQPLLMQGVTLRILEREGDSRSSLEIESLALQWQGFAGWISNPARLVDAVWMDRLHLVSDLRRGEAGETAALAWHPAAMLGGLVSLGGSWPSKVDIENSTIEFSGEATRWVLQGAGLSLRDREQGTFVADSLVIDSPRFQKVFGPLAAKTAWDGERFSLAGLDLVPGVTVNEISCEAPRGADPSVSFQARVFGGTLRGDWFFKVGEHGPLWDFAAVCSNVNLEGIPALLGFEGRAGGFLAEGRFTYRGEPSRPTDAEASLRVLAKEFRWNNRGWESLEIGASLIHRRLLVSNFDLRQKENKVALNGEISLSEGWSKIAEAPFLLNLRANIQELSSLADLVGAGVEEITGELQASGSLSGRLGNLDGFLGVKAKSVAYRGALMDQVDLEVLFQKENAEIVKCEVKSSGVELRATGRIGVSPPHSYQAQIEAGMADIAAWLRPFPALGGGIVSGGSLKFAWSGEGSRDGHSGAFDVDLSRFVSTYTPGGITGRFEGTYSPKNIHFSEAILENGSLRMQSRVTLATSGVNLDDVQLKANGKALLQGKAFLPVNPFTISRSSGWASAVLSSEATYLEANTPGELALGDLIKLAGQNWPLEGLLKFQIEAGGPAAGIQGKLSLQAREVFWGNRSVSAPSDVRLTMESAAGAAKLEGEILNNTMSPLRFSAGFPLGLFTDEVGKTQWIKRDAPVEATLDFPRAELALLRPVLKALPGISGELSGHLKIGGTLDAPRADGSIEIRNASFRFGSLDTPARFTGGRLEIENSLIRILDVGGEIEPGRFDLSGTCDFSNPEKPQWNLHWRGERIPVISDNLATLLADLDLKAEGDANAGTLQGEVQFVDSSIRRKIELLPLLSSTGASGLKLAGHAQTLKILAPFPNCSLDVKIGCAEPIRLTGQKLEGAMVPELRLEGTVEQSVPIGQILLEGLEFGLPGGQLLVGQGILCFFPDEPWEPFLMADATAFPAGYAVSAVAFGALTEGKWILRSAESIPPQALFVMLRNGIAPFASAPEGMGPVEFFLFGDATSKRLPQLMALRIDESSLPDGGIRLVDSLDFGLRAALLPMGSFEQGYEWKWAPAF